MTAPTRPVVEIYVLAEGAPNMYHTELATLDVGEALARADACDREVDFQRLQIWNPEYVGCWERLRYRSATREAHALDEEWWRWEWKSVDPDARRGDDPRPTAPRDERLIGAAERIMDLSRLPPVAFEAPKPTPALEGAFAATILDVAPGTWNRRSILDGVERGADGFVTSARLRLFESEAACKVATALTSAGEVRRYQIRRDGDRYTATRTPVRTTAVRVMLRYRDGTQTINGSVTGANLTGARANQASRPLVDGALRYVGAGFHELTLTDEECDYDFVWIAPHGSDVPRVSLARANGWLP